MNLLNIPQDVLLKILLELEVEDILCLERICTYFNRFISFDARHLWLSKLIEIDHTRAPGLPPQVDVDDLSCKALRDLIVKGARAHSLLMTKSSAPASYTLRRTICFSYPKNIASGQRLFIRFMKMSPGGRYLFMCRALFRANQPAYDRDQDLCILDTEKSNRCVWSHDAATGLEDKDSVFINAYDFDVHGDSSITLAIITSRRPAHGSNTRLSRVFRLSPTSASETLEESLRYSSISHEQGHGNIVSVCSVYGELAMFLDHPNTITIVNWKEQRAVKVRCEEPVNTLGHFRIWRDYLFYHHATSAQHVLRAVSLVQAMKSSVKLSSEIRTIDIKDLNTSSLRLDGASDQHGNPLITGGLNGTRYSIYDCPWKKGSNSATIVVVLQAATSFPQFAVVRAKFDSNNCQPRWTPLSWTCSTADQLEFKTSMSSELTRSGRLLISMWPEAFVPTRRFFKHAEFILVVLDQHGNAVLRYLPEHVARLWKSATGFRFEWYLNDVLESYLEEYTDALVILKDRGTGRDSIEIYFPD